MEKTETFASYEQLLEQLENRNWEEFWIRLIGRCFWILRKRYQIKWSNDEMKNFSREIVSDVVNKIFIEKTRNWNIDEYPDFEKFIVGVIDSHINNTLTIKKKVLNAGESESLLNPKASQKHYGMAEIMVDELRTQIHANLLAAGADDNELLIFECLIDGIFKPDDIRNELGMTETDFHNSWRRFKRKRNILKENLAAHGY